jgi:hypothetical protein
MKNLDLNAYGVSEMNQQEMQKVEGGKWAIFGKNPFGDSGWGSINLLGIPLLIYYEF